MRSLINKVMIKWIVLLVVLSMICFSCKESADQPTSSDDELKAEVFLKADWGYLNGTISSSKFNGITSIAFDQKDNLYVADANNNCIRKIDTSGIVSTYAGSKDSGLLDGDSTNARFDNPIALAFDKKQNLYVSQYLSLRKIASNRRVETVSGINKDEINLSNIDSLLYSTSFALAFDKDENLIISDYTDNSYKNRIIKLSPDKKISFLFGKPFKKDAHSRSEIFVNKPNGLAFDIYGNLFVTDESLEIQKIASDGSISHYSGLGIVGHMDGDKNVARYTKVKGVVFDKRNNMYVGDKYCIRKISPDGLVSTLNIKNLLLQDISSLAINSKNVLYVSDISNNCIIKIYLK